MAGEPRTSCCMFVVPITSKLLDSFMMQGDKEETAIEMIEEPLSLSRKQDDVLQLDQIR